MILLESKIIIYFNYFIRIFFENPKIVHSFFYYDLRKTSQILFELLITLSYNEKIKIDKLFIDPIYILMIKKLYFKDLKLLKLQYINIVKFNYIIFN